MEQQESWGVGGFVPELLCVCAYEYVFTTTYMLFHHYSCITKSALFLMESTNGLSFEQSHGVASQSWNSFPQEAWHSCPLHGDPLENFLVIGRSSDSYQGKPDVVCRVSVMVPRKIKGTEDKDIGGKSRFLSLGWVCWVLGSPLRQALSCSKLARAHQDGSKKRSKKASPRA